MNDDAFDSDSNPCSYCGASICVDSPRCPHCGNYTDGLGEPGRSGPAERRFPRIYLIAGWILAAVLILPILGMTARALSLLFQTLRPPH